MLAAHTKCADRGTVFRIEACFFPRSVACVKVAASERSVRHANDVDDVGDARRAQV